jgi:phosphohistidine phosphatase SixA
MTMKRRSILLGLAATPLLARAAPSSVLVIRHAATEPGVGDPPGYVLGRCETQRNLSAEGRVQARTWGQRLGTIGWRPEFVWSSRWCRCLDTAALIAQGVGHPPVRPWTALDSFFDTREREPAQTALLRERLRSPGLPRQLWVTHQVNISALTGSAVAMGQALWLELRADGTLAARPFDQ